ncbi:hypothetical protein SLNSH_21465 [Alsobacter soli]|uniref:OmpW family protein n=1 Tax=Alsobacter soli TaxID=2109933 RepID=A0A2T1HMQ5_9HYPH|nr:OmpW family protein [Alsobacter soli]PSC02955.1 hypothetical protein SLNSH_21465 [Alsobacter soli]
MKFTASVALAAALLAGTALSAVAADLPSSKKAPVFVEEALSPWMVRVRALGVIPQESTKDFYVLGTNSPGEKVQVSDSVVPELDITYFFTQNIAAELVLGTTPHNLSLRDNAAVLGPAGAKYAVGRAWLLPPTLTLQYHFTNFGAFKPYVGAGVNYTFFYNEDAKGVVTHLSLKDNVGFALQAGFDYMIDKHWGINVDVKKLWLETSGKATVAGVVPVRTKVNLDPWLVGVGVTYRF